ncbi:MAG: hypothetical protein F7C32_02275 [Desulfurococcales archaeon]|nr:hypothetical protein [Desulfurococcales archaeon]
MSRSKAIIGTTASLIAAFVIEYLLILIAQKGYQVLFEDPNQYLLISLIIIGGFAYYGYIGSALNAKEVLQKITPIALILAIAGILLGWIWEYELLGAILIVVAYFTEAAVAIKLKLDYARYSREWAEIFFWGVLLYVASLPTILLFKEAVAVTFMGNHVKIIGLIPLLYLEIVGKQEVNP